MFKKSAFVLVAIGALLFSGASAASAVEVDDPYGQAVGVTISPAVIAPGETSTIVFSDGYFEPGESIRVALSGEGASAESLAFLAPLAQSVVTTTKSADKDGSLTAKFTAPLAGNGVYRVAFSGSTTYTAVVTVAGGSVQVPAGVVVTAGPALALTGGGVSPAVMWVGVGALAAGLITLIAGATRRRRI